MESLWKMGIRVNEKAHKIVLGKFDRCLREFCEIENIKLNIFDEIETLNHSLNKYNENNLSVGVYVCNIDISGKPVIDEKFPQIKLIKNYNVYTFAHECGHHLAIKNFKDRDENLADHFTLLLAEEYLTNIERYIISIGLKVYSRIRFPLPKIKIKDWKKFKKEHNL